MADTLYKDASPFLAAGMALGRLGIKALSKTTRLGSKAVWKGGKFIKKHPGTAIMGAFTIPWVQGYSNTARTQTLSTMKRKLPKFASEADIIERETMGIKYPAFLYKIDGFEKMASDVEAAHNIVKKAFRFKFPKKLDLSTIIGATIIGTVPTAAMLGHQGINSMYNSYQTNKSYDKMLSIYPDLKRENQNDVRQYFKYINTYSPTVARNPHAAGSLIKRFVHSGGMLVDNSIIEGLLSIEKTKLTIKEHKTKEDTTRQIVSGITRQLGGPERGS